MYSIFMEYGNKGISDIHEHLLIDKASGPGVSIVSKSTVHTASLFVYCQ
jgi:hypothetical protein